MRLQEEVDRWEKGWGDCREEESPSTEERAALTFWWLGCSFGPLPAADVRNFRDSRFGPIFAAPLLSIQPKVESNFLL